VTNAILSVRRLSKSFGGVAAIRDASFDVVEGTISALIGPNGAGKTTLFNLITGLETPDRGSVEFLGTPLEGMPAHRIAEFGLVRTFQSARVFPSMTVLANLKAGAHRHGRVPAFAHALWLPASRREERALNERAGALLDMINLSAQRDMAATDLPMGAQKLLDVARALMSQPRLLLLDEPAAGLNDHETLELGALLRAIRNAGMTILLVEHNMSLIMSSSDRVTVLDAGVIVTSGTPEEVQKDPRVLEAYLGTSEGL
jgi:branched-chain amino acid transport system ATP-binding protein